MPISIASSALKEQGFDLIKTTEVASQQGFPWVQLFINSTLYEEQYFESLVRELDKSKLNIVIHLPNIEALNDQDISVAERLEDLFKERDVRTLIHYDNSFVPENVPVVNGRQVAIENSKTGIFDKQHISDAFELSRTVGAPFVFDIGRIMYTDDNNSLVEIISFITKMLLELDPERDILHVAGKSSWTKKFRDCSCALGSEDDIHLPLMSLLRDFSENGGVVVLENENLKEVFDSRKNLEP